MQKIRRSHHVLGAMLLAAVAGGSASAELTAYEGFDYPVGILGTQNGGSGFASAWGGTYSGGISGSSLHQVALNSLTVANYPFTTTGNHIEDASTASTTFSKRLLTEPIAMNTDTVRYMSFILQKDVRVPDTGASQIAQLRLDSAGTNRFIAGVNSDESVRLTAGSAVASPAGLHVGGVNYLYVVKIVTAAAALEDQAFLQVFKDGDLLTDEPATAADWTLIVPKFTATNATWNVMTLVDGIDAAGQFDEIRMGTTWADVAGTATPQKWKVDASGNWSDTNNWNGDVPNGDNALVNLTDAITAPRTVTLDAPKTAGTVRFNNANSYTINGSSTLTLSTTSGYATITAQVGTHTISAPVVVNDSLFVTTNAATDSVTLSGTVTFASGTSLSKGGAGTLTMNQANVQTLTLAGGTLKFAANGTDSATSSTTSLGISGATNAWTSRLDINDNKMVIDYDGTSPIATVIDQIKSGYAAGAWTGNGITSSAAAADAEHRFAVGFAEASALGISSFGGISLNGDAIVMRMTAYGDATLDGKVNTLDFNVLAANFSAASTLWSEGSFNFDGVVDSLDFGALVANFGLTVASPGPSFGAVVPEPGSALIAFALAPMLRRRKTQ